MAFRLKDRAMRVATEKAVRVTSDIAGIIREEIVQLMAESTPTGYTDEEGYQSSAPGEPPAFGRGVYARSWEELPPQVSGRTVRAVVRSKMKGPDGRVVAVRLEYGDETTAARPHVRIGLDRARQKIEQLIRNA